MVSRPISRCSAPNLQFQGSNGRIRYAVPAVILIVMAFCGCLNEHTPPEEEYYDVQGEVLEIIENKNEHVVKFKVMKLRGTYKSAETNNGSYELESGQVIELSISKNRNFITVEEGDYIEVDIDRELDEQHYNVRSLKQISHPYQWCYISVFLIITVVAIGFIYRKLRMAWDEEDDWDGY